MKALISDIHTESNLLSCHPRSNIHKHLNTKNLGGTPQINVKIEQL